MTFNSAMLESMAAMLPPGLAAAFQLLGATIPPIAEKVISGELDPQEAADLASADLYAVFVEMRNSGHQTSQS